MPRPKYRLSPRTARIVATDPLIQRLNKLVEQLPSKLVDEGLLYIALQQMAKLNEDPTTGLQYEDLSEDQYAKLLLENSLTDALLMEKELRYKTLSRIVGLENAKKIDYDVLDAFLEGFASPKDGLNYFAKRMWETKSTRYADELMKSNEELKNIERLNEYASLLDRLQTLYDSGQINTLSDEDRKNLHDRIYELQNYFKTEGKKSDVVLNSLWDFDKNWDKVDKLELFRRNVIENEGVKRINEGEYSWYNPLDYLRLLGDSFSAAGSFVGKLFTTGSEGIGKLLPDNLATADAYTRRAVKNSSAYDDTFDVLFDDHMTDENGNLKVRTQSIRHTANSYRPYFERKSREVESDLKDTYDKLQNGGNLLGFIPANPNNIDRHFLDIAEANPDGFWGSSVGRIINPANYTWLGLGEMGSSYSDFETMALLIGTDTGAQGLMSMIPEKVALRLNPYVAIGLTAANLYFTSRLRAHETSSEAMDALSNRILNEAGEKNIDLLPILKQAQEYGQSIGIQTENLQPVQLLQLALAFDLPTNDSRYEDLKNNAISGLRYLENVNNQLAVEDYLASLPYLNYQRSVFKELGKNRMLTKPQIGTRFAENQMLNNPKYAKLIEDSFTTQVDKLVTSAGNKLFNNPANVNILRRTGNYLANKLSALTKTGLWESGEEGVQHVLQKEYERGAYDDYDKSYNVFDLDNISTMPELFGSSFLWYFGLDSSSPYNGTDELQKAMQLGFISGGMQSVMGRSLRETGQKLLSFSTVGSDPSLMYTADDLFFQIKNDLAIKKLVGEKYGDKQDDEHVGIFYDSFSKFGITKLRLNESLNALKENKGFAVKDEYIDRDLQMMSIAYDLYKNKQRNAQLLERLNIVKDTPMHKSFVLAAVAELMKSKDIRKAQSENNRLHLELIELIKNTILEEDDSELDPITKALKQLIHLDYENSAKTDRQLSLKQAELLVNLEIEDERMRWYILNGETLGYQEPTEEEIQKRIEERKKQIEDNIKSEQESTKFILDNLFAYYELVNSRRLVNELLKQSDFLKTIKDESGIDLDTNTIGYVVKYLQNHINMLERASSKELSEANEKIEMWNLVEGEKARIAGKEFTPIPKVTVDSVFGKYGTLENQDEFDKSTQVGLIISALKSLQDEKTKAFLIGIANPNIIRDMYNVPTWNLLSPEQRAEYKEKVRKQYESNGSDERVTTDVARRLYIRERTEKIEKYNDLINKFNDAESAAESGDDSVRFSDADVLYYQKQAADMIVLNELSKRRMQQQKAAQEYINSQPVTSEVINAAESGDESAQDHVALLLLENMSVTPDNPAYSPNDFNGTDSLDQMLEEFVDNDADLDDRQKDVSGKLYTDRATYGQKKLQKEYEDGQKVEEKPQEKLLDTGDKKIKGRRLVTKNIEKLNKVLINDEKSKIEALNLISSVEANAKLGDEGAITNEELELINNVKQQLASEGYEIVDLLGTEYHDGMKVDAEFVVDDSLLPEQNIISVVHKPRILKDGVVVLLGKVTVRTGVAHTQKELIESDIRVLNKEIESLQRIPNKSVRLRRIKEAEEELRKLQDQLDSLSEQEESGQSEENSEDNDDNKDITVEATTKSGKKVTGKYSVSTDEDGFTKAKHEGPRVTSRKLTKLDIEDAGYTYQDLFGEQQSYGKDFAAEEFEETSIKQVVIRPDGSVSMITEEGETGDTHINASPEASKDLAKKIFPELFEGEQEIQSESEEIVNEPEKAELKKPSAPEENLVDINKLLNNIAPENQKYEEQEGEHELSEDEGPAIDQPSEPTEEQPLPEADDDGTLNDSLQPGDNGQSRQETNEEISDKSEELIIDLPVLTEDNLEYLDEIIETFNDEEVSIASFELDELLGLDDFWDTGLTVYKNYKNPNQQETGDSDDVRIHWTASTFFFRPESEDPIQLSVNQKQLKTKYPVKPGKELAKKLLEKGWFENCDKYYVVSGNPNIRGYENPDNFTVSLVIDDNQGKATYIAALGTPAHYLYFNTKTNTWVDVDGEQAIKNRLRKIGLGKVSDSKYNTAIQRQREILYLAENSFDIEPKREDYESEEHYDIALHNFYDRAKSWFETKATEEQHRLVDERARQSLAKPNAKVLTEEEVKDQIQRLKIARQLIIEAYCEKDETTGKWIIPTTMKTTVKPVVSRVSNGSISTEKDNNGKPIFKPLVGRFGISDDIVELTKLLQEGSIKLGYGLGVFGDPRFNILLLGTNSILHERGGWSGRIFLMVDTRNNTQVPVMLHSPKFNLLHTNNTTKIVNKNSVELAIDPQTGKINSDSVTPSAAEVILYLVTGKLSTDSIPRVLNAKGVLEELLNLFINTGENTDRISKNRREFNNFGDFVSKVLNFKFDEKVRIEGRDPGAWVLRVGNVSGATNKIDVYTLDEIFGGTTEEEKKRSEEVRKIIISRISEHMHWNTDKAQMMDEFPLAIRNMLRVYFNENPKATQFSLCGVPEFTIKKEDLFDVDKSGKITGDKNITTLAWMLKNQKLETDLSDLPFYAPFVFATDVDQSPAAKIVDEIKSKQPDKTDPEQPISIDSAQEFAQERFNQQRVDRVVGNVRAGAFNLKSIFAKSEEERELKLKETGRLDNIILDVDPNVSKDNFRKELDAAVNRYLKYINKKYGKNISSAQILYSSTIDSQYGTFKNGKSIPVLIIQEDGGFVYLLSPMEVSRMAKPVTGVFSTELTGGKLNEKKTRKWLNEVLGLTDKDVIVTDAILKSTYDLDVYGLTNVAVDILSGEDYGYMVFRRNAGLGIGYHEAFHFVNLLIHNPRQRFALYRAYVERHPEFKNKTLHEIEEALAEDFRKYMEDRNEGNIFKKIWNKFLDFINAFKKKDLVDIIFKNIQSGKYKNYTKLDDDSVQLFKKRYPYGVAKAGFYIPGIRQSDMHFKTIDNYRTFYDISESLAHSLLEKFSIRTTADLERFNKEQNKLGKFYKALSKNHKDILEKYEISNIVDLKQSDSEVIENIFNDIKSADKKLLEDFGILDSNALSLLLEELGIVQLFFETMREQSMFAEPLQKAILEDVFNNINAFKYVLTQMLKQYGIEPKYHRVKREEQNLSSTNKEKLSEDGTPRDVGDRADNIWDIDHLTISLKDNVAFRAKLFLSQVKKMHCYLDNGKRVWEYDNDLLFGSKYFSFGEAWNNILKHLWQCQTWDEIDETTGKYKMDSVLGRVQHLAKSQMFFRSLWENLLDVGDDIELQNQILSTVKKYLTLVAYINISDPKIKKSSIDTGDFDTGGTLERNAASISDRNRLWEILNDNALRAIKALPREWSKAAAVSGMLEQSPNGNIINLEYAKDLENDLNDVVKFLKDHKQFQSQEDAKLAYNEVSDMIIRLLHKLSIPFDESTFDCYVGLNIDDKSKLDDYVVRYNTVSDLFSVPKKGNINYIISGKKNKSSIVALAKHKITSIKIPGSSESKQLSDLYTGYKRTKKDDFEPLINLLAKAYDIVYPSSEDFLIQLPNGSMGYPITENNSISDDIQRINYDVDGILLKLYKSPYSRRSVLRQVAENTGASIDKSDSRLKLNAFTGIKDDRTRDGLDYFEISPMDDYFAKMAMTFKDMLILPTMADKKTWYAISGENLKMVHDVVTYGNRRFSEETLDIFEGYFYDELEALEQYYSRDLIAYFVLHPDRAIKNFHGKIKDGRMDFSGNGGLFRYFYDIFTAKDDTDKQNPTYYNLNQLLELRWKFLKEIESNPSAYGGIASLREEGYNGDLDGFELVRSTISGIRKRFLNSDEARLDLRNRINNWLNGLVDTEMRNLASETMLVFDYRNGTFYPWAIPKYILDYYAGEMQKRQIIDYKPRVYRDSAIDPDVALSAISSHVASSLISIIELEKVFSGDPAFYKLQNAKIVDKETGKEKDDLLTINSEIKYNGNTHSFTTGVHKLVDKSDDKIKRLGALLSPGANIRTQYNKDSLIRSMNLTKDELEYIIKDTYSNLNIADISLVSRHMDYMKFQFGADTLANEIRSNPNQQWIKEYIDKHEDILNVKLLINSLYLKKKVFEELLSVAPKQIADEVKREQLSSSNPYNSINVSDAQVFIRPEMYRKLRLGLGQWSVLEDETGYSDEKAYEILQTDGEWMHDSEKAKIVRRFEAQALKMTYFSNDPFEIRIGDKSYLFNLPIYNKMAIFPLFKYAATSDVGRILYDRMNKEGHELDMISFESAVKVGLTQNIYSPFDGKTKTLDNINPDLNDTDRYVQTLRISGLRLQLNTESHEATERGVGTLMFKIAFSNIIDDEKYGIADNSKKPRYGKEIKHEIMHLINALTYKGVIDVLDEYYNGDQLNQKAVDRLIKRIIKTLNLGAINEDLINDGVVAGLMSRQVFEQAVNSDILKKVVEITTNGGTAVQQSAFGWTGFRDEENQYHLFNEGKSLDWNLKDGSMEVMLSINFFKSIVPHEYQTSYSKMRQWLIDHDIIKGVKSSSEQQLLQTKVVDLNLSVRTLKFLESSKINTLGDLINKHPKSTSKKIDSEINDILDSFNLSYDKDLTPKKVYSNPKPFGIGYRIPTQGMSSMFGFVVADVLPEQSGDLIIVPEEFTAQTGSDFDVDKIYLATLHYDKDGKLVTITDDQKEQLEKLTENNFKDIVSNIDEKAIVNTLLLDYLTIVTDVKNFSQARASIDTLTNILKGEILPLLKDPAKYKVGGYELLPSFQSRRKLEFTTGKDGIGPFALSITNLALTLFTRLTMDYGDNEFNFGDLYEIRGQDGKYIAGWLSAMVNAHVDVAKDPYIFDLNINGITYNHITFLLRAGKGRSAFTFIALPILKEYVEKVLKNNGIYGNNLVHISEKNKFAKTKTNIIKAMTLRLKKEFEAALKEDDTLSKEQKVNLKEQIELIIKNDDQADWSKAFDFDLSVRALKNKNSAESKYYQILVLKSFQRMQKYVDELQELVRVSLIDTKKFGNNIASHLNFLNQYNIFKYGTHAVDWYIDDHKDAKKDYKKIHEKNGRSYPFRKYFNTLFLDSKLKFATKFVRDILRNQSYVATDTFAELFNAMNVFILGEVPYTVEKYYDGEIKSNTKSGYEKITDDKLVQAMKNAMDNVIRYRVLLNVGAKTIKPNKDYSGPIDFTCGGDPLVVRRVMSDLIFGKDVEEDVQEEISEEYRYDSTKSIFSSVAEFIQYVENHPMSKAADGIVDPMTGYISNEFLKFLRPQPATNKFPIGRMLLAKSLMKVAVEDKQILVSAFDQLLRHEDVNVRKLARSIAFYAYYSAYDQNTPFSFFDLVPKYYRQQYDDALRKGLRYGKRQLMASIASTTDVLSGDTESSLVLNLQSDFLDIISRNYWYDDKIVPAYYETGKGNSKLDKYFEEYRFNLNAIRINKQRVYPAILTKQLDSQYMKIKKPNGDTYLYKKVGVIKKAESKGLGVSVYIIAPKLGLHEGKIHYYEFATDKNYSMFVQNDLPGSFKPENVLKLVLDYVNEYEDFIFEPQSNISYSGFYDEDLGLKADFGLYNSDNTVRFDPSNNVDRTCINRSTLIVDINSDMHSGYKSSVSVKYKDSIEKLAKKIIKSVNLESTMPYIIYFNGGEIQINVTKLEIDDYVNVQVYKFRDRHQEEENLEEQVADYEKELRENASSVIRLRKLNDHMYDLINELLNNNLKINYVTADISTEIGEAAIKAGSVLIEDFLLSYNWGIHSSKLSEEELNDLKSKFDDYEDEVLSKSEEEEIQDVIEQMEETEEIIEKLDKEKQKTDKKVKKEIEGISSNSGEDAGSVDMSSLLSQINNPDQKDDEIENKPAHLNCDNQ